MSSQPTASKVTSVSPFTSMLRASFVPSAVVGLICVVVFAILGHMDGALSSLFGAALALGFFASGLTVLAKVRNLNPLALMAGAMAVFLGQVIVLVAVLVLASQWKSLDGPATGITVAVVVIAWQIFQVRSFMRTRHYVYDPDAVGSPE